MITNSNFTEASVSYHRWYISLSHGHKFLTKISRTIVRRKARFSKGFWAKKILHP